MIAALLASLLAFLFALAATPKLMEFFALKLNLYAKDLQKPKKPFIPTSGGIALAASFLAGFFAYIAIEVFLFNKSAELLFLFAGVLSILILTFIGFFDDLTTTKKPVKVKRGEKDIRVGLSQKTKFLLTIPSAIPLMAVNAGVHTVSIPFVGSVDFGIFYPLLFIPFGYVFAANAINMFAGFNGSEAGMGIVYVATLAIIAYFAGSASFPILLIALAALIGYIRYNWYPAMILPGDSLTYFLGGIVATSIILGNIESYGVIVMTPFIIEFFLKARSKFRASSLGKLQKNGKLKAPYGKKIYSLTHLIMNVGEQKTEKQVVFWMIFIEAIACLAALGLFAYLNYL